MNFFLMVQDQEAFKEADSVHLSRIIATLAFALLCFGQVEATTPHDPKLSWETLESPHFLIHFHQGEAAIANELAAIAEYQHLRLSRSFNWSPKDKTHIVLTDRFDFSNGWATPIPQNHITLITRPPSNINSLEDYDHWLELVFIHEYTHILHMDMASGSPKSLRNFFGRMPLLFPHMFQPSWLIEGLATEYETDHARGIGRGQGALFRGLMAIEWQQGIKPLSQVNVATTEWPAGSIPYLYGVYFQQFLSERYGEAQKQAWLTRYSRQIIPFRINSTSERAFEKDLYGLWGDFELYLDQNFENKFQHYKQQSQSSTAITHTGFQSGSAQLMENGDLYYIADSLYDEASLVKRSVSDGESRAISDIWGQQFDVHPKHGILIVQPENTDNSNIFNEIYLLSHGKSRPEQLTKKGRYQFAIWDQQQIIAIHYTLGRFALHRLNLNGELLEVLWQGDGQTTLAAIDISPDGSQLIGTRLNQGKGWDLALFDMQTKEWHLLTQNDGIEMQPRFNQDGTSILFSADYSGFYEIYQLDLHSSKQQQLTQSWGGASYPILSNNGKMLYYNKLTANGWDLHQTKIATIPQPTTTVETKRTARQQPPTVKTTTSAYQAISHITPQWWLPFFSFEPALTTLGATTSGSDPLFRHQYGLSLGLDSVSPQPFGYFSYRYSRWRTELQLTLQRRNAYYKNDLDEVVAVESGNDLTLSSETPFIWRNQQWGLHSGLVINNDYFSFTKQGYITANGRKNSLLGVALSYNNSRYYPRSVSAIDGRTINLVIEKSNILGGDFKGVRQRLDWREYIRLGRASTLAIRYKRGWGEALTPRFKLGGHLDNIITLPGNGLSLPPFNQNQFALRGYPEGLPSLQGQSMQVASAELRLPIMRLERTASAPPIGLQQLYGSLFYDIGSAWDKSESKQYKRGVGIELYSELLLGYRLPFNLSIGVAKGLDEGGERQLYIKMSALF